MTNIKRSSYMNESRSTILNNFLQSARTLGKASSTSAKLVAKGVKDSGLPELAKQHGRVAADALTNLNISGAEKVLTTGLTISQKIAENAEKYEAKAKVLRENTDTVRIPETAQRISKVNELIAEINK